MAVSPAKADLCLKNLVKAGVIAARNGGLYTLAYESAELAAHFLFVENNVHFRCGRQNDDGSVAAAECIFLQAGVHDVIMVDIAAGKLEISSLSSYAMIDAIKRMMTTAPSF